MTSLINIIFGAVLLLIEENEEQRRTAWLK